MNEMKPISNFKNNLYKVAIILLLAYAAYSTAMKDLDRLQEVAGNVESATTAGLGSLAKVYSATRTLADGAELARAPQVNSTIESPRVDTIAAGGSVALAGLERSETTGRQSENSSVQKVHNASSCPVRQREFPKAVTKDLKWDVVAQPQKRNELLRHELPITADVELARLVGREPRLRAIIRKLPLKSGKTQWTDVGEFKSLSDLIGFGLKVARVHDSAGDRKVDPVEATEDASRYVIEFKQGASDTDREELEMRQ